MRKISGQLVSSKPVSLSRASKLISRFAAVENGSSPAVSIYLQRTAEAFNHLVQFHNTTNTAQSKSIDDNEKMKKRKKKIDDDGAVDSKKKKKKRAESSDSTN